MPVTPLEDGCLVMVIRDSAGINDDDGTAFAPSTRYYPYRGDGSCGQFPENSRLFGRGTFVIDNLVTGDVTGGEIILYDGNGNVLFELTRDGSSLAGNDLLRKPIRCSGLPSASVSALAMNLTMFFRAVVA